MKQKYTFPFGLIVKVLIILVLPLVIFRYVDSQPTAVVDSDEIDEATRSIAVVNEDNGIEINKEQLLLGAEIPTLLSEQDDYSWTVVNRSAAEQGLNNRRYDAIIFVPSDFSESVMTFKEEKPKKAAINYLIQPNLDAKNRQRIHKEMALAKNKINQEMTTIYWSYVSQEIDYIRTDFDSILEKEIAFQDAMYSFYQPSSQNLATEIEQHKHTLEMILNQTATVQELSQTSVGTASEAENQIKTFTELLESYKNAQLEQQQLLAKYQLENKEKLAASVDNYEGVLDERVQEISDQIRAYQSPVYRQDKTTEKIRDRFGNISFELLAAKRNGLESWESDKERLIDGHIAAMNKTLIQLYNQNLVADAHMNLVRSANDLKTTDKANEQTDDLDLVKLPEKEPDKLAELNLVDLQQAAKSLRTEFERLRPLEDDPDNDKDPDEGETPDNGKDPDEGETPDNGEDPDKGETPDNGKEPDEGETPDNGKEPDEGETPDNDKAPDEGQSPEQGGNSGDKEVPSEDHTKTDEGENSHFSTNDQDNGKDQQPGNNENDDKPENEDTKDEWKAVEESLNDLDNSLAALEENLINYHENYLEWHDYAEQLITAYEALEQIKVKMTSQIIESILQSQQKIIEHHEIGQYKEPLEKVFFTQAELKNKDIQLMIAYQETLAIFITHLDNINEGNIDRRLAEIWESDEMKKLRNDFLSMDKPYRKSINSMFNVLLDQENIPGEITEAKQQFNQLMIETETYHSEYNEQVKNEFAVIATTLSDMTAEGKKIAEQLRSTNAELFEWEDLPSEDQLDGQLVFNIQKSTLVDLQHLSDQIKNLDDSQENITGSTTELQSKVNEVQQKSDELNNRWSRNIATTELVKEDIYDILGNTLVDGQENPFVYNYLANPVEVEGQVNGKVLSETDDRLPPVIMFIIILISGLLIGFITNYYNNTSYIIQGGLFLSLNLAVGLIISIYGLSIYTLEDSQALLWTMFTILLLATCSNIIRGALFINPFVGWLACMAMIIYFVTPLIDIVVPEFTFNNPIANTFMGIQYGSQTTSTIWTVTALVLITLLASAFVYTLQILKNKSKVHTHDEEKTA